MQSAVETKHFFVAQLFVELLDVLQNEEVFSAVFVEVEGVEHFKGWLTVVDKVAPVVTV